MGIPLYTVCCFNLVAYNIFSLSLIFAALTTICLGVVLHGLTLFETLCFLCLYVCFLSQLRKVFSYESSNMFSVSFALSSPFGTPVMKMLVCSMSSQRSVKLPFLFILFFCSVFMISITLSFSSVIHLCQ